MERLNPGLIGDPKNLDAFAQGVLLAIETVGVILQGLAEKAGQRDMPTEQIRQVLEASFMDLAPAGDAGHLFKAGLVRLQAGAAVVKSVQDELKGVDRPE